MVIHIRISHLRPFTLRHWHWAHRLFRLRAYFCVHFYSEKRTLNMQIAHFGPAKNHKEFSFGTEK